MTLEEAYKAKKKEYEGLPKWQWSDEGVWYAVANYYLHTNEFTEADMGFAKKEGILYEVYDVLRYNQEYEEQTEKRIKHGKS